MDFEYYELLQVTKTATKSEIKKAYRKLAMKYHPDRNPDDKEAEEMFKKINEAYQVLSDDEKRAIYDRYGKAGLEGHMGSSGGFSGFEDIFEEFFGFGGRSRKPQRQTPYNLDILYEVEIDFKEAVFGVKKEIEFDYFTICEKCNGTGAKKSHTCSVCGGQGQIFIRQGFMSMGQTCPECDGTGIIIDEKCDGTGAKKSHTCPACGGQGQIFIRQGFMSMGQTCPECDGSGIIIEEVCEECKGAGYKINKDKVEIDLPAGVDNGMRMRVRGKGNEDFNKRRGDLYIQISVKEDKVFKRRDDDIFVEVPIFFTSAILGDTIKIPTLNGEKELEIKPHTKDGKKYLFRGEGIVNIHTGRKGDLIAILKIIYPEKLTDEQKELLEKLHKSFGKEVHNHKSFFEEAIDKVKGWFK